jgi:hypothetical protein
MPLADCGFDRQAVPDLGLPWDNISACNRRYGDSMPADIHSFSFAPDAPATCEAGIFVPDEE